VAAARNNAKRRARCRGGRTVTPPTVKAATAASARPRRTAALTAFGARLSSTISSAWHELLHGDPGTIPALDALRSLAILLVFSDHAFFNFSQYSHSDLRIGRFPLILFGWTGVDLFFVLSGYLIGGQLWRELKRSGHIRIGRFLLRRGLRIWPYYFAFCAFVLLTAGRPPLQFLPDLVFLSNYFTGHIAGGWSLSTEEQFYIIVPLLMLAMSRSLGIARQWIPLVVLLATLPIIRAIVLAVHGAHQHGSTEMLLVTYTPIHTHADGLVAGVLLSWLSVMHPAAVAARPFLRNLPIPVVIALLGLALRHLSPDLFAFTGLAAVFGAATLFLLRDRSWLTLFTGARVFHFLSRLSYSMYLNHFVVLGYLGRLLWRPGHGLPATTAAFIGWYVLALMISIAIAVLTFTLIEWPFLQLRDRILHVQHRAPAAT